MSDERGTTIADKGFAMKRANSCRIAVVVLAVLMLAPALAAGLVLDGFEERSFPPEHVGGTTQLSWDGRFSEIPAALVVRLRRTA